MDIWNPNWTVAKSLFWYQDQILDIYCWVRVPMRLNFTQHGHHCGLIWLNIGNLPNTPHISKLKTVLWKVCLHRPKGDPNWWFCRGWAQDYSYFEGRTILSLNTQSDLVMPLTGHLWPKLDCCTTSFPISGPLLNITGFLVKCGLIWLNMDINAAWFDWTLAIYTTLLTFRDWK